VTIGLMFLGLVALILINVPIAVALGVVAMTAMTAMVSSNGVDSLLNAAIVMFTGATSFPLLAIPLFILAGAIMNSSSLSRRLIALASALFGFVKGGLAMITIGTSMFFAEISGSAVADVAAMGSILIPAMEKKGYPKEFAAAVMSSSATLAVIIPPSIPMILYAVMADTSVVQIFVAGIVPGVVAGGGMMVLSYWYARRYDYPVEEVFQWQRVKTAFRGAAWALLLPLIILGGIFGGVVTATEGAALAVIAALAIGLLISMKARNQVQALQLGRDERMLRFVVRGTPQSIAAVDPRLKPVGGAGKDLTVVEAPRYAQFSDLLGKMADRGTQLVEISGNDDIFLTLLLPPKASLGTPGAQLFTTELDEPLGWRRVAISTKVPELLGVMRAAREQGGRIEHVYDY